MKKVLVLCTGNSIRSQIAEAYLNFYATEKGIFFSAGIEGTAVSPLAVRVMNEDNIDLSEHLSKSLATFEGIPFDYLITVCEEIEELDLPASLQFKELRHLPIPDPDAFVGSEEERLALFRETRETLKKNMLKFIGQELLKDNPVLETI